MQRETLRFLEDYISEEQLKILERDANLIRTRMSEKTDEQRLEEAVTQYKNPRFELLQAIRLAEKESYYVNYKKVIRCAVMQHDFVTALYWHKLKMKEFSVSIVDKFECYYYTVMAEQQKHHQPDAEPYTSVRQMCSNVSDISDTLQDKQYLEQTINYQIQQTKAYQEKFDSIEKTILLPAKERDGNAAMIQVIIGLILLIVGGIFLWKTYGIVSAAIKSFFGRSILSLITWVIPILYAVLVIAADFVSIYLLAKNVGVRNKMNFKGKLAEILLELENQMKDTDAYRSLQEMNMDMPQSFHSYDARLVLATLSTITGEQDTKKLCEMINDKSTWLSKQEPSKPNRNNPYKYIDDFFRDDASDTNLFIGYTLNIRLYSEKGLSYDHYNGVTYRQATLTPDDFTKGDMNTSYDFIEKFIRTPFGGKNRRHNELLLFNMVERFLLDEALLAERKSDFSQMGDAYFELYNICIYAKNNKLISGANQKIYAYGLAGVEHCDLLKWKVMYDKACYDEDSGFYDPYESLGFTRADAIEYAKSQSQGDRDKLLDHIKEIDRRAQERAAEARKAEIRAYWEEKGRLMREAEEAREKARADLNARMDSIERDTNLLFNGEFSTVEDRILLSNRSDAEKTMALVRYDALREAAIRKKLDDM